MSRHVFFVLLFFIGWSCQSDKADADYKDYEGSAFGTEYRIQFFGDVPHLKQSVDSIIEAVNQSMSNYQEDSDISKLNQGDTTIVVDPMFKEVFLLSKEIYEKTDGYFDPTIGNVVNAYGFGAQKPEAQPDSIHIDSLMQHVGFDKVGIDSSNHIIREDLGIYIDLNAIAKGYGVDQFGIFLEGKGIKNYLVEIGGEMRARGRNLKSDRSWRLGIDDPRIGDEAKELQGVLKLKDKGMATSGNYRKYRMDTVSGQKFVHIINPKTGYMQQQNLLSASVVAEDCAIADAYATAFMAMDIDKSINLSRELNAIDVFFIYDEDGELKTYLSPGFEEIMVE